MKYPVTESGKKHLRFDANNEVELTNTEAVAMKAMGHVTDPKPAEPASTPMATQPLMTREMGAESAIDQPGRRGRYQRSDMRAQEDGARPADAPPQPDSTPPDAA